MSPPGTARMDALARALRGRPLVRVGLPELVLRPAAVLVPLFLRGGEPWVLLTRRRADLRAHAGQISFPGGACDASDPAPSWTALREAEEEVGLPHSAVQLLGPLDEYPTVTFFKISPFVGLIPEPHALAPSPAEVEEIIEAPLSAFRAPGVFSEEAVRLPLPGLGRFRTIVSYQVGPHRVWGATAAILQQLLELEARL